MTTRLRLRTIVTWVILCAVAPSTVAQTVGSRQGTDSQVASIGGQILDALSRKPVSLAEVTLRGTALKGSTDLSGRFAIHPIPRGTYALEARRIGYEPLVFESIQIDGDTTVTLALTMMPLAFQLREVAVTPGAFSFMGADPTTRQTMSRVEIESAPFGEDLFRAVNRLPGLSSGDYAAHFSIRGGRHDETLILLDGLELYEPYHMKDFNEGALSIVDVGAIEGVELVTGDFPAKYGDKRSGVFSIASRTPKGDGTRFNLGLSLTNARAMAEGTFAKEKGSWLFSARRGYVDLVLGLINKNELPSPRFEDILAHAPIAGRTATSRTDHGLGRPDYGRARRYRALPRSARSALCGHQYPRFLRPGLQTGLDLRALQLDDSGVRLRSAKAERRLRIDQRRGTESR